MKQKFGTILRILSLSIFIIITTLSFANGGFILGFLILFILILILLNISQVLNPLNFKSNINIYIGMLIYFGFIYLWATNYGFRKSFEYHGIELNYQYSIFNGSYQKLFGKNNYDLNKSQNEINKQKAIDVFWFIQCEHYENEKNYTEKQKADIKAGKFTIYSNYDCKEGNLKDLIVNEFKINKMYRENYNYLTKQKTINIDTILKYKVEIFNIPMDE